MRADPSRHVSKALQAVRRRQALSLVLMASLLACQPGASTAQTARAKASGAQEVARYGDWIVAKRTNVEPRTCFAASQPVEATPQPKAGAGNAGFFYVTSWPSAGVKLEPSVMGGAQFREGTVVTISVGRETFAAFAADGSAYIADLTAELKLIDAMKKGSTMVVEGLSTGGVRQRAVYSLKGVTQALSTLAGAC